MEKTAKLFLIFLFLIQQSKLILLFIHGGGFVEGDKSKIYSSNHFKKLINNLLKNDIGFVSVNYCLVERKTHQAKLKV